MYVNYIYRTEENKIIKYTRHYTPNNYVKGKTKVPAIQ